jgi:hypothetical protein
VKPYEAVPILSPTAEQAAEAKAKEVDLRRVARSRQREDAAPSKVGGLVRKASGGGSPAELHEAKVEYRSSRRQHDAARRRRTRRPKPASFTLKRAVGLAQVRRAFILWRSAGMFRR